MAKKVDIQHPERTPTQVQAMAAVEKAIAETTRLLVLWYGGIRAGKTEGAADCFVEHSRHRSETIYIVGGYTTRSVFTNVAPYLKKYANKHGLAYKEHRGNDPRIVIGDNTLAVYGGSDMGRDKSVQGATAAGLLLDEYELLDRRFILQCEARISLPGALRIYTSNKDNPYSWATKNYLYRALKGEIEALVLDADTADNQFLDKAFIEEKIREYDDNTRRRFIDNEFALASPPLYRAGFAAPGDTDELGAIYAYGSECIQLGLSKVDKGWVIREPVQYEPPFDIAKLGDAKTFLVNATAPMLAREIRAAGRTVIGYDPMFRDKQVEVCQRAFSSGKLALEIDSEFGLECVNLYSVPGRRMSPMIVALENVAQYLTSKEKWG